MLLGNDLFSANSKLREPIEMVHFDGSQSPVMNRASTRESVSSQIPETSDESVDNQMSASFNEQMVYYVELATPGEQTADSVELATSGDQIVETGVTLVESEMVSPSSDLN